MHSMNKLNSVLDAELTYPDIFLFYSGRVKLEMPCLLGWILICGKTRVQNDVTANSPDLYRPTKIFSLNSSSGTAFSDAAVVKIKMGGKRRRHSSADASPAHLLV